MFIFKKSKETLNLQNLSAIEKISLFSFKGIKTIHLPKNIKITKEILNHIKKNSSDIEKLIFINEIDDSLFTLLIDFLKNNESVTVISFPAKKNKINEDNIEKEKDEEKETSKKIEQENRINTINHICGLNFLINKIKNLNKDKLPIIYLDIPSSLSWSINLNFSDFKKEGTDIIIANFMSEKNITEDFIKELLSNVPDEINTLMIMCYISLYDSLSLTIKKFKKEIHTYLVPPSILSSFPRDKNIKDSNNILPLEEEKLSDSKNNFLLNHIKKHDSDSKIDKEDKIDNNNGIKLTRMGSN